MLLDATKVYMYVFLLAGCEVVLSAVVLCICNMLFIKKTPQQPEPSARMEMAMIETEMEQLNKVSQDDQENHGEGNELEPKSGEQSTKVEEPKDTTEDPDKPEAASQDEGQVDSVELELSKVATKANGGVVEPESSL